MATLAVLRSFTPLLRPSVLPLRSILYTPVRHASKTSKVASKATPTAKLPASTIARKSVRASLKTISEYAMPAGTPKSPRVKKAAKPKNSAIAIEDTTAFSDSPATKPLDSVPPTSDSNPAKVSVQEPTSSTSKRPSWYDKQDWSNASRGPSWTSKKPESTAASLAAKRLTRSVPRLHTPNSSPFALANNNAVVHQYFCRGLACKARSYTSSAYAATPDPIARFNLGSVAMIAASASLGAGATLGAVHWMSSKASRTVEQVIVEEPITHEPQRLV